ncbi:MAG: hypothetical protein K8W52_07845 [Deltaproteobacteria bacterium]|nr:hypothetical protein [Deltaproteobacteria bacterium]
MTPWPSSAFEIDDASTATGRRLALTDTMLPHNENGELTDPALWNRQDGFSAAAPIVMSFDGGVDPTNLVPATDPDASITDASPTVIVDMTTGEKIVHFAEVDLISADTPDRQALFLRPMQRLTGGHRYAVALKRTLKGRGGADLPVPPGMQALLDGSAPSHPLLDRVRARFPAVVDALAAAGVTKDQLLLAWDFTVESDESIRKDTRTVRDRGVAAMEGVTLTYHVNTDEVAAPTEAIRRRIDGTFDAPLFLTNEGRYVPRTILARDADGLPVYQKLYQAPFTAIVPACAYTSATPVGMIVYGHGLLGDSGQVASGAVKGTAADLCMVIVGTDMRGMSASDIGEVARALTNMTYADEVFEVQAQGILNHVALARAMRTSMAATLFVDDPDGPGGNPPRSLVDPTKVYYYGLSQGGIFGGTVMAYDPTITRGVLGVGAANYSLMLERSTDWLDYRTILAGAYPDPLDIVFAVNLMQQRWDQTDPSGIANSLLDGTATGVPPKQILLQVALGDEQVPNIASEWEARTMGLPILTPSAKTAWKLTEMASPIASGSAMVYYDGGAPVPPVGNTHAEPTGQHDLTRNAPAARRQMKTFYETGMIVNECADGGACMCAAGKCD